MITMVHCGITLVTIYEIMANMVIAMGIMT